MILLNFQFKVRLYMVLYKNYNIQSVKFSGMVSLNEIRDRTVTDRRLLIVRAMLKIGSFHNYHEIYFTILKPGILESIITV